MLFFFVADTTAENTQAAAISKLLLLKAVCFSEVYTRYNQIQHTHPQLLPAEREDDIANSTVCGARL